MTTYPCNNCKRDHALFYWVSKSGKRILSYICNRIPKLAAIGEAYETAQAANWKEASDKLKESL